MIPCVSLAETSVIGNMKERVKEMKVFGCRLNFWNHIGHSLTSSKAKEGKRYDGKVVEHKPRNHARSEIDILFGRFFE